MRTQSCQDALSHARNQTLGLGLSVWGHREGRKRPSHGHREGPKGLSKAISKSQPNVLRVAMSYMSAGARRFTVAWHQWLSSCSPSSSSRPRMDEVAIISAREAAAAAGDISSDAAHRCRRAPPLGCACVCLSCLGAAIAMPGTCWS